VEGSQRQGGVLIDVRILDYELGRRATSRRHLCEVAGVPEATLSRACHGRPIRETTLRRLTAALLSLPLHPGTDLLVLAPETNSRQGARSQAAATEAFERGAALEPA